MPIERSERRNFRRGLGVVEVIVIMGAVAIAAIWGISWLGTAVSSHMTDTAGEVANPTELTKQRKANNGLGNGSDDGTPGKAPENDGAGTSPGNPGNQGGAKK